MQDTDNSKKILLGVEKAFVRHKARVEIFECKNNV